MKNDDVIDVFKAEWPEFLKWCESKGLVFDTLEELCNACDSFVTEALRIRTKYDN